MDNIKVENESLVRDINNGAILETDIMKLHRHRARIASVQNKDEMIESLNERINRLEQLIERMAIANG